jgi:hypothetical protein
MATAFYKHARAALDTFLVAAKQGQNRRCKSALASTTAIISVDTTVAFPVVAFANFSLQCCWLEGEGCKKFVYHQPNVFTICTPFVKTTSDDWSACILDRVGDVVSICLLDSGVQITYRVYEAFPIPEKIYVSILFRGVCVFPVPVEICQAEFQNLGRLAFSFSLAALNRNDYTLISASPYGFFGVGLFTTYNSSAFILEISKPECESIPYLHLYEINKVDIIKRWRFTNVRSIIGITDTSFLAEVSFENVVLRTFSFSNVFSFDICLRSDRIVLSFMNFPNIVVAKLSTEETLHVIIPDLPGLQLCNSVSISLSGKLISVSRENCVHVYNSDTNEFIQKVQFGINTYFIQFLSDETILVYDFLLKKSGVANIYTKEATTFLENINLPRNMIPDVQGPYGYCLMGRKLCAYL